MNVIDVNLEIMATMLFYHFDLDVLLFIFRKLDIASTRVALRVLEKHIPE